MCGRYNFSGETIAEAAEILKMPVSFSPIPAHDVHPGDSTPVFTASGIKAFIWGYPGFNGTKLIFNTRSETATEKKLFRGGVQHGRVLIAASCFYEWDKGREKYFFRRSDASVMFLAGISDLFDGVARFSILTTSANASMKPIHDRMPLILEEKQVSLWLCDDKASMDILRQEPVMLAAKAVSGQLSLF